MGFHTQGSMFNVEIIVIGLIVGFVVGLTGVGGAAIMTPLLILLLKVNPTVAVGTDLVYSVPTRLYGAYLHAVQRTVNWKIAGSLLWGGVPAALVGLAGLYFLHLHHVDPAIVNAWTRRAIGITLFLAAGIILVQPFIRRAYGSDGQIDWTPARRARIVAIGAIVGLVVTITSIGSGSVTLPLLTIVLPMVSLPELIGSDIAFAAFLTPVAAAGRWTMGDVNLPLAVNLLIGSLPGVYLGSKLCGKLSQTWLRPAVALTLVYVAVRMV
ncbi:MAG: sulfite exporter TauE/SafE family protein [Candidatus Eremiobacteraeota bacterium]|nr:sulfite exporter TauE/SafE family protein [Candidatus Eremiobacteraeota bacterium]